MSRKNVLACNCLNIIIELESNENVQIFKGSPPLSVEGQQNAFFKQELLQINKLKGIDKQYASLVSSSNVGDWITHYCINCGLYTHAVHRELGTNCVLVMKNLLTSHSVDELRKNDSFSKVFNIIINQEQNDSDSNPNVEGLWPDVEITINNIKRLASESINQETAKVEEKIRNFAERENATLEAFCEKIRKDQSILVRILINGNVNSQFAKQHNSRIEQPLQQHKKEKFPFSYDTSPSNNPNLIAKKKLKSTPQLAVNSPSKTQKFNSNDSEGLFHLDGVDEIKDQSFHNCDSSDNEDTNKEERYKIKSSPLSLAKSLPINIPVFLTGVGNRVSEGEREDPMQNSDDVNPSDIAASIKALAKSVHGDAVFGDLPKPRICNQF